MENSELGTQRKMYLLPLNMPVKHWELPPAESARSSVSSTRISPRELMPLTLPLESAHHSSESTMSKSSQARLYTSNVHSEKVLILNLFIYI